jgi:hypothetical protein
MLLLLEEAMDRVKSKKARISLTKRGHVTPLTVTLTHPLVAVTTQYPLNRLKH